MGTTDALMAIALMNRFVLENLPYHINNLYCTMDTWHNA